MKVFVALEKGRLVVAGSSQESAAEQTRVAVLFVHAVRAWEAVVVGDAVVGLVYENLNDFVDYEDNILRFGALDFDVKCQGFWLLFY